MKFYIENNEAIPAVIVQESAEQAPVNYTETTDIVAVEKNGLLGLNKSHAGWRDKKNLRDILKTLIYTKMQIAAPADVENQSKFDLLTDAEKSVATHWFLVGKESFQLSVVNDDKYWTEEAHQYRLWTEEVKEHRLARMESLVFRRMLDVGDAKQVLSDLNQLAQDTIIDIDDITNVLQTKVRVKRLARMYVEGLGSLAEDGVVGLRDFVDSTTGTPFASGGFRNYNFTFRVGHTADSVADELLEIIDGTW
jgi:hypothetical protein